MEDQIDIRKLFENSFRWKIISQVSFGGFSLYPKYFSKILYMSKKCLFLEVNFEILLSSENN